MAKRPSERKEPDDRRPEEPKEPAANCLGEPKDSDERSPGDGDRDWFDRAMKDVEEATGLSAVFVHGTVKRALARVGVDKSSVTPEDFVRALPSIRRALEVFRPPGDEGGGRGGGGAPAVAEVFVQMPPSLDSKLPK